MSDEEEQSSVDIAVIGMAGRFPGAPTLAAFWDNLCAGVESISFFSEQELAAAGIDPELTRHPQYVPARGTLDNIDLFDAAFFDLTRREAELLDPQQRLFLECAWEALEHAGYTPERYPGAIGVYGGASASSYAANLYGDTELVRLVGSFPIVLGNSSDYLTTRVSYKLNLQGPSVNVQTACSTSLVAVHQACQSLLNYQCDLALAGGVAITVPHRAGYLYQEGGIVSPDGHCRAFDAQAKGFVGGNGVGVVALKRLQDALDDGDTIQAVIKGSAVTNDGALKAGYTAPSETGQAQAIALAQAVAGVDPATITYIEAHGTGTALGDPIEIAALNQVFRDSTDATGYCAIGSVKTNIGHLDAAAGIAGLIKAVLALHHGQLPPSLHYTAPNPAIDFASSPFYVNTELRDWASDDGPRRAGVSSFGIGGTNAHLVLEEAPASDAPQQDDEPTWHVLPLSAKTASALEHMTSRLASHLQQHPELALADVAHTLQVGRSAFNHRRVLVCQSAADALTALGEGTPQRVFTGMTTQRNRPTVFLFPGQGAQYVRMTAETYHSQPVFREHVDRCAELLKPQLGCDLRAMLYPEPEQAGAAAEALNQTWLTQPALFVIEYALAQLWISWGVQPEALLGHSIGEYVAATIANVISLEDALPLVALRGRLMQRLPGGALLATPLPEHEVRALLDAQLDLAAVNGPAQCVVAGPVEAIEALQQQLAAQGIDGRRLAASHAFHSAMVEPIVGALTEQLRRVDLRPPQIPYISNVTGAWITAAQATDPAYWAAQLRQTVRFGDGIALLLQEPERVLLEVGPGQTLSALARRHPDKSAAQLILASLPHRQDQQPEAAFVLQTLGRLWLSGVPVRWDALYEERPARRIPLPTYPFERQRYWVEPAARANRQPSSPEPDHVTLAATAPSYPEDIMAYASAVPTQNAQRQQRLTTAIQAIVSRFIGSDTIDAQISLFELGFDSLLLIQFNHALQDEFGVHITLVQLIEQYTTIERIAAHLDQQLPPEAPAAPEPAPAPLAQAAPPAMLPAPQPYVSQPQPAVTAPVNFVPPQMNGAVAPGGGLEWLMGQQIQAMSQLLAHQLDLLRPGAAPATAQPVAMPAVPPVATAQHNGHAPATAQHNGHPPAAQQNGHASAAQHNGHPPAPAPDDPRRVQPAPFVAYRPLDVSKSGEFTPQQQRYLEQFTQRYTERTRESKRLTQRYRPVLADSRSTALFRLPWKELVYPIVGRRSLGSTIWDVDGNAYVDVTMGFGVHLFGHSPRFIMDAVEAQLKIGVELGPQSHLAGEVAQVFCQLTGMERVNFCNSGTEAVMGALRIARTVTRRTKIACFVGSYHGWSDTTLARPLNKNGQLSSIPMAPGVPANAVADVVALEYDRPESLEYLRAHAHELAAVLVEPVQSRRPDCQPRAFLQELRAITAAAGTALIFDEMICGFRAHPGGAQAIFGVEADIATYGKVIGGGFAIGAVAGKARWMDTFDGGMWQYGDDSYPQAEKTLFAGAFFKHPLTMAAALAVLNHLMQHGPALQDELNQRTARLAATLNALFEQEQVPIQVVHFSSLFRFNIPHDSRLMELFFYHLTLHGIYNWEGGNCFLSTAHTDEDLQQIVRAAEASIADMRAGGLLPPPTGPAPGVDRSRIASLASGAPVAATITHDTATTATARPASAAIVTTPTRTADRPQPEGALQFSLYFFGNYPAGFDQHKYDLLFDAAKFGDSHGFSAIWLPERHFHSFGGFSPNPVVLAAALARETEHIQIRAGSVALPLHNPIRVAEEWAVVDNLSRGRIGVSFASGWHPDDFVFAPDAYQQRRAIMAEGIATIQQLWRGDTITPRGGAGNNVSVQLFPQPMQRELPIWLTSAQRESFVRAGELGFSVLTNLQDQTIDELREKIALYRAALAEHGHAPERAHVTVLLHTFVSADQATAIELAREPFYAYMKASLRLVGNKSKSQGQQIDLDRLSDDDLNRLLSDAYQRYLDGGALIGSPDSCAATIERLRAIGVDEIGCFIDFGVTPATVLANLPHLQTLHARYQQPAAAASVVAPGEIRVPLTDAQQGMWVLSQSGDENAALYNESVTLDLHGPLDVAALHQALQTVVDRHESLRTTFSPDGDDQIVHPTLKLPLTHTDLSSLSAEQRQSRLQAVIAEESHTHLDLEHGPLIRAHLIALAPDDHRLILTIHHLVIDGQSLGTVLSEMSSCYAAIRQDQPANLPAPLQFRDYVAWLARQQQGAGLAEAERYWLQQFAAPLPILDLPTDRPRPPRQTYAGTQYRTAIDADTASALKQLAAQQGSTLFMLLLAGFNLLLHRLTQQDDIVIGSPWAGQRLMGNSALTGYCLNLLPLRSRLHSDASVVTYLSEVRRTLLEAFTYQHYSFGKLLQALKLSRDPRRAPLVNVLFIMEKVSGGLPMLDLTVDVERNPMVLTRFDLGLNIVETDAELRLECDYNTDLFDGATIELWLGYYKTLLAAIVRDPQQPTAALPLLSDAQQQLIRAGLNPAAPAADERCIHQLFEAQAARTPDQLAVILTSADAPAQLTYRELNARADQLARYLRSLGVAHETRVGLFVERSLEMIVGLLGVLKANGAYVPLDPNYPAERLQFMLDDAGVAIVLTEERLQTLLPDNIAQVVCLDRDVPPDAAALPELTDASAPDQLAYVMYTSGSTGTPKGVMIAHRGLVSFTKAMAARIGLEPAQRFLQFASFSFDASAVQIYPTLISGATLVLHPDPTRLSNSELYDLCVQQCISVLDFPAAFFQQWIVDIAAQGLRLPEALRVCMTGGESWSREQLRTWANLADRPVSFLSSYGPTEATVTTTLFSASSDQIADLPLIQGPLGEPLDHAQVYILDSQLRPAPMTVAGEIYLGGVGLARGYNSRPALTAERFVPHPFAPQPGARLYRTGDLARVRADGNIEFLGRADQQVKLRGFRIELGEIAAVIQQHPSVREAVVLAREAAAEGAASDKRLVAYVVPEPAQPAPTLGALRAWAQPKLPPYMLPSAVVALDMLPLTPSGKLDQQALPLPDSLRPEIETSFAEPRTPIETQLAAIWCAVLRLDRIGIHDDFFTLGGHSLLVTQIISRVRDQWQIQLPFHSLFETPTIAGLAETIAQYESRPQLSAPIQRVDDDRLLAELDQLSDQDVDALLNDLIDAAGSDA
jgi:natural product biosynthesis luciferase-like monooxygenase protein/amino acid adenylation domain-containing protein